MKRREDDSSWKEVMREVFDDLLRFIDPEADEIFDMGHKLEFLDKELAKIKPEPVKASDGCVADKLVKVFRRDGGEEWVLMPISAIAIFTGRQGRKMPVKFKYANRKTNLCYAYQTFSILDYEDAELAASDNSFAFVVLAAKTALLRGQISDEALCEKKAELVGKLLGKKFRPEKENAVFDFLDNVILFKKMETQEKFEQLISSPNKNNTMGICERLRQQGRQENLYQVVRSLLERTSFSVTEIADIVKVPVEFVCEVEAELKGGFLFIPDDEVDRAHGFGKYPMGETSADGVHSYSSK